MRFGGDSSGGQSTRSAWCHRGPTTRCRVPSAKTSAAAVALLGSTLEMALRDGLMVRADNGLIREG